MNRGKVVYAAILPALLIFVVPVSAAPIVTWSPGTVATTLLQGTQDVATVSFSSAQNLRNVDLRVSRKLRPLLSVSPTHFDAIPKNTQVTLALTFSAAQNTLAKEYTGKVRLRRGGSKDCDDDNEDADPNNIGQALLIDISIAQPTSTTIPSQVSLPSADRFVSDSTGVNFARDEMVVFVYPATTQDQVISLAGRYGASFLGHDDGLNFYQLRLPLGTLDDALRLLSQLEAEPIVRFAVPHFFEEALAPSIPDDPSWSLGVRLFESWGQSLVSLPDAWSLTTGSTNVKLGIVDVGFDPGHEDFVVNGSLSDLQSNFDQPRGHGTAVASIAAAVGNNARGLAGVMWASDLRLYSCSANNGNYVSEPRCWQVAKEAIDRGARVINISLASNWSPVCFPLLTDLARQLLFERSANGWRDVISHAAHVSGGVVFVFGAGNDLTSFDLTSGAALSKEFADNVLSVGAVSGLVVGGVVLTQNPASYSNFGELSVWAPGGDGSVLMCGNRRSNPPIFPPPLEIWTAEPGSAYGFSGPGTSLAAPFVAGTAGLMLSANPNITAAQIKNIIMTTADDTGKVDPSGNPIKVLNAFNAVQQALAPPPTGTFMKALGTPGDDYASSIQRTSDGGFIIAGYTTGLGAGGQDVLLVKLDPSGAMQWAKTAGTAGSDVAYSVRQTSDGGYIVSGYTDGVTGVAQFLVSKFDGTGAFQWASTLGDPSDSAAGLSAQQTTDGGYVATGFPGGALGGLGLLKYNGTGQLQWLRRAIGTNIYGNSVQQTSDGGYIVAGSQQRGATQYDLTLLKFDGLGNLQWAQLAGGSGNESGGAVQQTSDGGYIVSGRTASFGPGENTLLLKYDGSGTLQWARAGGGSTSGSTVQQTADGGYFVAGSTASFGAGGSDILLIRTDANGNIAGCSNWSSVTPSIGTTFPSAATSYSVDSPSFGVGAPSFSVATAPLIPNSKCP